MTFLSRVQAASQSALPLERVAGHLGLETRVKHTDKSRTAQPRLEKQDERCSCWYELSLHIHWPPTQSCQPDPVPSTDLDVPVLVHDQVAALEVTVYDRRAVGVQVEHSARRLEAGNRNETSLDWCLFYALATQTTAHHMLAGCFSN